MTAHAVLRSGLVEDLLRPSAYPEPRPLTVELRSTHASWVFMAGGEVWKVRRPVDLGFLDHSTPERRRRAAEDEVRLGRRLAHDVYRGVEPLRLGSRGYTFAGGDGAIVDCAVRMRRLPDEESALALVRAGRLGPAHLERLCARLAAFYAAAPRAERFGDPALLAAQIEENYRQTLPYAGRFVARARLDLLLGAQHRQLAEAAARLRRRARAGRVREGHGDLRLEHVYFPGAGSEGAIAVPEPIVIDPIEFDPAFRCQDVACDVAFLAMELDGAGRSDLAAAFLAAHARAADDHELYAVVDLFLGHRAWVRAKVACFVAADPETPRAEAARRAAEAARLFELAVGYAGARAPRLPRRPAPPTLLVVGGMIASGKSTLAEALGRALGAPVLSSDATRKRLSGVGPTARAPSALYGRHATVRTYRALLRAAAPVLASGRDAVVDATFREARFRRAARALAQRLGARFLFLAVDADDDTLRARLRARAGRATTSDAREDLLPWMCRGWRAPSELPPDEVVPVDGRAPTEAIVAAVRARLA